MSAKLPTIEDKVKPNIIMAMKVITDSAILGY
ncbi:uncharacterized protein METZ01_LOCUS19895 [marine metagenome]|uniref:Uncharacterized protein n=1 Tax=marine metagenome TaxID=408172 RepID=A0A381PJ53_9ZZZZ